MTNGISRVHYFDEQFLRTSEFEDEQRYHVAMRRRHNLAGHSWGIVAGLELVVDEGVAYVQPGLAVDALGREIVLTQRQALPAAAFADKGSTTLQVWIEYDRVGADPAPPGYVCGNGERTYYRWQERPLVTLRVPDPAFPDPRRPEGVLEGDLEFASWLEPPDDPRRLFPVFLGHVIAPASPEQPPTVDLGSRPYAGLVGEQIRAPSGSAWVRLGTSEAEDGTAFAVHVVLDDPTADPNVPRLVLSDDGTARIEGETTVAGDLTLEAGSVELLSGRDLPTGAKPWQMYHVHDTALDVHELRIELAGGSAGDNQVVLGAWSKKPDATGQEVEAFHPCLSVADDGTVTVHGNLVVTGAIVPKAGEAGAELTPRMQQFLAGALMSGVGGASSLLDRVFRSPLARGDDADGNGPG